MMSRWNCVGNFESSASRSVMAHTFACPECERSIPNPDATECPACGASLTKADAEHDDAGFEFVEDDAPPAAPVPQTKVRRKKGNKKRKVAARRSKVLVKWLAIGGALLVVLLLIGGFVALILGHGPGGPRTSSGSYAVIEDLPDAPLPAGDDSASLPEPEGPKAPSRIAWTGKPDPAAKTVDYSNA